METIKVAKNLLLGNICDNCAYYSNVYRVKMTGKKQQCLYDMQRVTPLPDKGTCKNWRLSNGKAR